MQDCGGGEDVRERVRGWVRGRWAGHGDRFPPAVLFTVLTVALIACNMRDESWKRSRLQWGTCLSAMPEKQFFTLFRMDYRTFKHVLDMTEHGMQRHYLQSERAGGYVSPEAQLAFTIRWLAGGSYLDIADHYGVSKATFYRLVYECIDLIIDAFPISFPLSSEDALGSLAADFVAKQSKTIFMRVVGAIDGILVKIRCPSAHECHGAQLPIPLQSFSSTQPTQHILHKLLLTHI